MESRAFKVLCDAGVYGEITCNKDLLAKVVESFPYPIQIFSLDGTARIINKAAVDMIGIKKIDTHVGVYNVFKDPFVMALGFMDRVKQVLEGETVYLHDFNAPYQEMKKYYNLDDRDIQTISVDITCFPLKNENGEMEYFAAVFIFKEIYRGKKEVDWGRRYIEENWNKPFNAGEVAKAACLSKVHFTKLFKKHVGVTPHEYYINIKISKLKDKLLDPNLTIAQAFAECNLDYNGHTARIFKEKTGVSPSVYRKMIYRAD